MHLATLQLAPVLAAEKSRVPFYIAGGVLVAWALVVSLAFGMRRPDFPGGQRGERIVIAVSCGARARHGGHRRADREHARQEHDGHGEHAAARGG